MTERVAIVIPVYNDWPSLRALLPRLQASLSSCGARAEVIAIDDGSSSAPNPAELREGLGESMSLEILHLACNLGHQRAIATGLAYLAARDQNTPAIVMDSDGEDRPEDIPILLGEHAKASDSVIVANRDKRSEGALFSAFYALYRLGFVALTGHRISFGNFCLIPAHQLRRLVYISDLWNNLPATIIRSRVPIIRVSTQRGSRLFGRSSMNFVALVVHGLSAMAVFIELIFVRLFLVGLALVVAMAIAITVVVSIKLFTDLAIPGWASSLTSLFFIILLQAVMLLLIAAFLVLGERRRAGSVPALQYDAFVFRSQKVR